MDNMGDEDDAFDEGADVPPVTTVEETVSRKCVRDNFKRICPRRPVRSCSHPGCLNGGPTPPMRMGIEAMLRAANCLFASPDNHPRETPSRPSCPPRDLARTTQRDWDAEFGGCGGTWDSRTGPKSATRTARRGPTKRLLKRNLRGYLP